MTRKSLIARNDRPRESRWWMVNAQSKRKMSSCHTANWNWLEILTCKVLIFKSTFNEHITLLQSKVHSCMHAKLLHWCQTLCNPMDCSPPGCPVHGILQTGITGVDCHALLQGIFLTQGSNPCLLQLLHCRWILYCWATRETWMLRYSWAVGKSDKSKSFVW